jgi:methyl coenzyme M reductase beta subunit
MKLTAIERERIKEIQKALRRFERRIAGLAMQGLLSNSNLLLEVAKQTGKDVEMASAIIVLGANIYADALISELNKDSK